LEYYGNANAVRLFGTLTLQEIAMCGPNGWSLSSVSGSITETYNVDSASYSSVNNIKYKETSKAIYTIYSTQYSGDQIPLTHWTQDVNAIGKTAGSPITSTTIALWSYNQLKTAPDYRYAKFGGKNYSPHVFATPVEITTLSDTGTVDGFIDVIQGDGSKQLDQTRQIYTGAKMEVITAKLRNTYTTVGTITFPSKQVAEETASLMAPNWGGDGGYVAEATELKLTIFNRLSPAGILPDSIDASAVSANAMVTPPEVSTDTTLVKFGKVNRNPADWEVTTLKVTDSTGTSSWTYGAIFAGIPLTAPAPVALVQRATAVIDLLKELERLKRMLPAPAIAVYPIPAGWNPP
jgi:hypothetical protein